MSGTRTVARGSDMRLLFLAVGLVTRGVVQAADAPPDAGPQPPIRVIAAPLAAAVEWSGNHPSGAMVDLWSEVAERIGRRTSFIRADKFTEELLALKAGTADVALGPLAITAEREREFDLTHSVVHSGLRIAVRETHDTGVWAALRGLPWRQLLGLVATVLGLAVLSGHLLWWFERGHNPKSFPDRYPRGVWEAVWWIASTIVTGGCDDKHVDGVLGRGIAFAWMVGGIVFAATFTGLLTASMTAERMTGRIRGPRDLPSRVVGCQELSVTVQVLRSRGAIPREFARLDDALDALAAGAIDAVVSEAMQLSALVARPNRHDLVIVGPIFESFDFGMGLPAGSPLREAVDAAILDMREDGAIERIMTRWFGRHE